MRRTPQLLLVLPVVHEFQKKAAQTTKPIPQFRQQSFLGHISCVGAVAVAGFIGFEWYAHEERIRINNRKRLVAEDAN